MGTTGGDTLSLNTLALFKAAASLESPISSRRDKTPSRPRPIFQGPQEEVTIEIRGEVYPLGWDRGEGSMASEGGAHGHAPVPTVSRASCSDDGGPSLQEVRQSRDKHRDMSAIRPGVAPIGARSSLSGQVVGLSSSKPHALGVPATTLSRAGKGHPVKSTGSDVVPREADNPFNLIPEDFPLCVDSSRDPSPVDSLSSSWVELSAHGAKSGRSAD